MTTPNADPNALNEPFLDCAFEFKLTVRDLELIAAMQQVGGHATMEEVFEQAVYHYAQHLQMGAIPLDFMAWRHRLDRLGRFYRGKGAR